MADDKKSNNSPSNPAKNVKTPQLPTKNNRDGYDKRPLYSSRGERK